MYTCQAIHGRRMLYTWLKSTATFECPWTSQFGGLSTLLTYQRSYKLHAYSERIKILPNLAASLQTSLHGTAWFILMIAPFNDFNPLRFGGRKQDFPLKNNYTGWTESLYSFVLQGGGEGYLKMKRKSCGILEMLNRSQQLHESTIINLWNEIYCYSFVLIQINVIKHLRFK